MNINRLIILGLLLINVCISQPQIIIADSLSGQELLDYVIDNYKTTSTLGYDYARDTMYSTIDIHDDSLLSCVYTGFTIVLDPLLDPSTNAYQKGINCEHTWPQSMGADVEPQKSDMHHLFPCKDNVNSSRGNDPYAEIPDQNTEKWYRLDYYLTTIPTEYINEYAEKENDSPQSFEPREDHKGDAARAMFYFFAIYNDAADTNFWNVQKDIFLQWHYTDPVDLWEYNRSNQIGTYQDDIPNPFVLDSTLARRIWYTTDSDSLANDIMSNIATEIVLYDCYPNPFNPVTTINYYLSEAGNVRLGIYDILGRQVVQLTDEFQEAGYKSVQWNGQYSSGQNASAGLYFYIINFEGQTTIKRMVLLK